MRFLRNPEELRQVVLAVDPEIQYIVIDEIQKVPKLLDVVHLLLESDKSDKQFILTGSSAKKLKAAGVNLLAGRAFTYNLFPFSYLELEEAFDLNQEDPKMNNPEVWEVLRKNNFKQHPKEWWHFSQGEFIN